MNAAPVPPSSVGGRALAADIVFFFGKPIGFAVGMLLILFDFFTSRNYVRDAMPLGICLLFLGLIGWLYFALLESSERGATVGKMALGLRVVTDKGERLTFLNAPGAISPRSSRPSFCASASS
jgi:uncharacterized RDD family membrane protein YckC